MRKVYRGSAVLSDCVKKGCYVAATDGIITYVGEEKPDGETVDLGENYIAPGFVDLHCHASAEFFAYENPEEVANYHAGHGTTGILLSLYRNLPHGDILRALEKIKTAQNKCRNILGAHMEGPYLNSKKGTGCRTAEQSYPDRKIYGEYIKSGIIRQWTSAPEIEGVDRLIVELTESGIVPAIGHSAASYEQVKKAYGSGAKIVTHIFDATGTAENPDRADGTQDVSFDEACMLMPDMYYEVICDRNWVHLRREKLSLLIKTVGIGRVAAITDCFKGNNDGADVNMINGELSGSKLTMDKAAKNLFDAGYSPSEISLMTALNPCKALGLKNVGEIKAGYKADLIELDEKCNFIRNLNG